MTDQADDLRSLVTAASAGDAAALERLVALHVPRLRAFVRLRLNATLRAKESSSDVVQSVCRELFVDLNRFQWEGEEAFRAWLFTAAARKVADKAEYWGAQRRDAGREAAAKSTNDLLDAYQASAISPSRQVMGEEGVERIEQAIDSLPDEYREAIMLSRVLGLSRAEVAKRMGKTEDSVRHLLFRGLAQLGRTLERRNP